MIKVFVALWRVIVCGYRVGEAFVKGRIVAFAESVRRYVEG